MDDTANTNEDTKEDESAASVSECEFTPTPLNQSLNSVNLLKMLARELGNNKLNDMLSDIEQLLEKEILTRRTKHCVPIRIF
ncbi:hypothetical protein FQR65_LT10024 [Abscondita terminalis]|nr:hypothetical protein FQR65_LT10024 [Abscondita terminalis]